MLSLKFIRIRAHNIHIKQKSDYEILRLGGRKNDLKTDTYTSLDACYVLNKSYVTVY